MRLLAASRKHRETLLGLLDQEERRTAPDDVLNILDFLIRRGGEERRTTPDETISHKHCGQFSAWQEIQSFPH